MKFCLLPRNKLKNSSLNKFWYHIAWWCPQRISNCIICTSKANHLMFFFLFMSVPFRFTWKLCSSVIHASKWLRWNFKMPWINLGWARPSRDIVLQLNYEKKLLIALWLVEVNSDGRWWEKEREATAAMWRKNYNYFSNCFMFQRNWTIFCGTAVCRTAYRVWIGS